MRRIPLGTYRGLRFGMVLHPQFPPEAYLEGAIARQSMLSREHHGPRAILNAAERLVESYGSQCELVRRDLAIAEGQLRDYQARLGVQFAQADYQSELSALRDQLKVALSGGVSEEESDPHQKIAETAGKIKGLLTTHISEATSARVGVRRSIAEVPVTTRIRQRTDSLRGEIGQCSPSTGNQLAGVTASDISGSCSNDVIPGVDLQSTDYRPVSDAPSSRNR